jgi:thioredoxin-related protein
MTVRIFYWILFGLWIIPHAYGQTQTKSTKPVAPPAVKWVSMQYALKNAEKNDRIILIDFYTDWCGWCKVMDKKTYTDSHIIQYLNQKFYAVKFDAEGKDTVEYKGREYSFVPSLRCNQFAYKLLNGNMGYPTTVFMNATGEVLTPVPGYLDAPTLESLLKYYGERNHENGVNYDDFRKNFQPSPRE